MTNVERWEKKAAKGARFVYRVGPPIWTNRDKTGEMRAAWRLQEEGRVFLFQRRLNAIAFEYYAIRAPRAI